MRLDALERAQQNGRIVRIVSGNQKKHGRYARDQERLRLFDG